MSLPAITPEIARAAVSRVWAREFPNQFVPASPATWAEITRRRSDHELAQEVHETEYNRARNAGFEPEMASRIAAFEVRLAMRKTPRAERREEARRARTDAEIPSVGSRVVYDANTDTYRRTDWIYPERHGIAEAAPYPAARHSEHANFATAEAEFEETVEEETGVCVDEYSWAERMEERRENRRQSHVIANKLECGGTPAYRTDEYQLHMVSVFSGHAEQLPGFRQICFIPHVAAMVRAKKLMSLEYFLECHPFCRFWTFTSGTRVPASGLRKRVRSLHARINKLNKELRRRYGVEIVFRATELGSVETTASAGAAKAKRAARAAHRKAVAEAKASGRPVPVWTRAKDSQFADAAGEIERDETTGEALYHPHAHCVLYMPNGQLSKEKWSEMLRFVWDHWGDHWDDGKIIEDAREACKYVTKPGEMSRLAPAELCALEAALHGLHLVTPMGVLKEEIRLRNEAGQKLRRKRTPDGYVFKVGYDHNRQLSTSEEEKDHARRKRRQERLDYIDAKNRITSPTTGELVSAGMGHTGALRRKAAAALCRVVARCEPAAVASPIKEPRVVVMASRGSFCMRAVRSHPLFVKLWNQGIQAWEAGRAIRVHTSTTTGEQRLLSLLADTDERFAPSSEAIWKASIPAQCVGSN